jgi:hypothetical protein
MAYGEYTFAGEANVTPFFEVMYAKREYFSDFGEPQLFLTFHRSTRTTCAIRRQWAAWTAVSPGTRS